MGLYGGEYGVVLRDYIPWVVDIHMICVLGFDWHLIYSTKLLGVLLPATYRRLFMVSGARWSAVARFSVLDWAYSLGLCFSCFTRVNFLILALVKPSGKLSFLSLLSVWACPSDFLVGTNFSPLG
ncbi:hypothetical protein RchiOBHm_Chr2g0119471 [Rosa chinensis]|uniref:Uncharacterized protein n=1 Tax=Rosa chinensis TaxID=74649 RepID=A0A2P6RS10_ROSCH|nr:hypothetical protein RchiOBHm_Chr2g0119471 [Rosa chinensis]